jgi:hypothetical protein
MRDVINVTFAQPSQFINFVISAQAGIQYFQLCLACYLASSFRIAMPIFSMT